MKKAPESENAGITNDNSSAIDLEDLAPEIVKK